MRHLPIRVAIACVCAAATAVFAGVALAGNGKDTAPGQLKKTDTATVQTVVTAGEDGQATVTTGTDASVHADVKVKASEKAKTSESSDVSAKGSESSDVSAKASESSDVSAGASGSSQASANASAHASGNASWHAAVKSSTHASTSSHASTTTSVSAGVKPGPTTEHWTTTTVGASPDVSKRYGNGQTAAQIASSRGASAGTVLTGPGNSQPHKVSACGTPSNPSGGVDVHAVKSYDASACASTGGDSHPVVEKPRPTGPCEHTTQTVVAQSASTPPTQTPPAQSAATQQTETHVVAVTTTTPAAPVSQQTAPAQPVQQAPAKTQVTASSKPGRGVLGAQANVPKPSANALGTVQNVAGTTLPFTGFPLWLVALAALGLIGGGLVLRRQAAARV